MAVLVLVAVLVGALVPVLFQLRTTLRAAELALRETRPRIDEAMQGLSSASTAVSEVAQGLQSTTRIMAALGAAIGPALAAGLSTYRSARSESVKEDDHEQGSTEHHAA